MNRSVYPKCIMIIAGESSGDLHGANLVKALSEKRENLFFCGIGGPMLTAAGVRIVVDASELAVVGITEAFLNAKTLLKGMGTAKGILSNLRPDLLILIDFPDFNLHVAATAKKLGIPVLYYISPQIWAWRRGRVKKIQKLVDHMAVILPFEKPFFEKADIPVTFVGHPLLDSVTLPDPAPLSETHASGKVTLENPVIGLLPGSRGGEISRHLPVMLEAARLLARMRKRAAFVLSVAPMADKQVIENIIAQKGKGLDIILETGDVQCVFNRCHLVIAASGTVTLEAAIAGIPGVVIYKVSPTSYWLGKALVRVDYICLANLIADKAIFPELLQSQASPKRIADEVMAIITDSNIRGRMKRDLLTVRNALGGPGASQRVADIALEMIS